MTRAFFLWLLIASTMGWGVYELKYRVVKMDEALAKLNREIISDQESIRILHAEWSYLNQPTQIGVMAAKYLTLQPMKPKQMVALADLPTRAEADALAPALVSANGVVGPRRTAAPEKPVEKTIAKLAPPVLPPPASPAPLPVPPIVAARAPVVAKPAAAAPAPIVPAAAPKPPAASAKMLFVKSMEQALGVKSGGAP